MKFRIDASLSYMVNEPSTLITSIHAERNLQIILEESFSSTPQYPSPEILASPELNRLIRFYADQQGEVTVRYTAIVDNAYQVVDFTNAEPTSILNISESVLSYLFPSRYCQSDKLFRFADRQFGGIDNPFLQVLEIVEWIHKNVEYLSGSTNSETSAYDIVTQQAGVCRDFAHLGIALCRALTIPARYCSVYAYLLQPQDFHACFEAWIAGRWIIFDATKLAPLNGLLRIATGRDAADTAISNIFGDVEVKSLNVDVSYAGDEEFRSIMYEPNKCEGIAYGLP